MSDTTQQHILDEVEKQRLLAEVEFTVKHIVPACGSLFPSAVDRAQEADFVTWMQSVQSTPPTQNEDRKL